VRTITRNVRRRFGISAPKMSVRLHVDWYWRMAFWVTTIAVAYALGLWIYDAGMRFAGFDRGETEQEINKLRELSSSLQKENDTLRAEKRSAERQLQIEKSAQTDLAKTVRALQAESIQLKEEVAFFQSMMAPDKGKVGITISRFQVEATPMAREYRYKLVVAQGGQRDKDFSGSVQLQARLNQNGQAVALPIGGGRAMPLNFRYYQPLEGTFQVPDGGRVAEVEARVFENGNSQPKVVQTTILN
jgi:hypothetical protein